MFRTSRPVTAAAFFDREEILARLSDATRQLMQGSPKWLGLVGPRRVGKTSLLLELARRHEPIEGLDFVVLDLLEVSPLSAEVWRWYGARVAEVLLGPETGAALSVSIRQPNEFRRALHRAPAFLELSETTRHILNTLPEGKAGPELARNAVSLPERLATELDRHVIVAVDEFQELTQLEGKRGPTSRPFHLLRSAWQLHQRVGYIISGSSRGMLTELIVSKRSPFFLHFDLLEVGPFSQVDAQALLVQGGLDGSLAAEAVRVLGGHPFYLQLMGEELMRYEPPHDKRLLKEALQSLVFSRTGRLSLFFAREHDRIVGHSALLAATLDALSTGPLRASEIARRIKAPSGDTSRYLERLGDVVEKLPDERYALVDPVFGAWIAWRRPGGSVIPMTLVGDAAERQVAARLAALGFDLVYQSRASRGAFDLLATRGAKQLGLQVKRSKLPARFTKTEWRRMHADAERLGWSWVIACVDAAAEVTILDPARASLRREVRLGPDASIDNLLAWLDEQPSP